MNQSPLQNSLRQLSTSLGFRADIPFAMTLPCGRIEAAACIHDCGNPAGMLLVTHADSLGGLDHVVGDFGFGVCRIADNALSSDDCLQLLQDWGWQWPADE